MNFLLVNQRQELQSSGIANIVVIIYKNRFIILGLHNLQMGFALTLESRVIDEVLVLSLTIS